MRRLKKIRIVTALFSLAMLALHLFASFNPSYNWNYGFFHLKYFSVTTRVLASLFLVFLIFPSINQLVSQAIFAFCRKARRVAFNKYLAYFLISSFFFAIFWYFRMSRFYADAPDIVRQLARGKILMTNPLTDYVRLGFFHVMKHFGFDMIMSNAFSSAVAGFFFVFVLLMFCDSLAKESYKKTILFLFVITLGTLVLFFGDVENYAIMALFVLIYIFLSFKYLKGRISIIWPSIAVSIAFMLHMSAGMLFPSLIYLASKKKSFSAYAKALVSFVIPLLLLFGVIYFFEWNQQIPKNRMDRYGRFGQQENVFVGFYPLLRINYPDEQRFTMFSAGHLIEIVNEHILISTSGIFLVLMMLFFFGKKLDRKDSFMIFLFYLCGFYLLYTSTRALAFESFRDWNHFAPVAIPYTILGAYLLIKYVREKKTLIYVSTLLIVLSLIHTIPWILANAYHPI